jgi:hypothetical protein
MTTFKVGDKVKQLALSKYRSGEIGQTLVIDEVGYDDTYSVIASAIDGSGREMLFRPSDLELIVETVDVISLPDLELARLFEATVREIENRAYLSGYNQGKFDAEAERVEVAEPAYEEIAEWNEPVRVATDQDIRDAAVEQAKKDVEELSKTDVPDMGVTNILGYGESFYPGEFDYVDFVVDREKRTVVALIKYLGGNDKNRTWARGVAKCDPTDTFNEHLGKAIALRRALGLDVPEEYIYAPEPTEFRAGDVMESTYHNSFTKYVRTIEKINGERVEYTSGSFDLLETLQAKARIIDDSRTGVITRG